MVSVEIPNAWDAYQLLEYHRRLRTWSWVYMGRRELTTGLSDDMGTGNVEMKGRLTSHVL